MKATKNEELRMALGLLLVLVILIGVVVAVNTYDLDNMERLNIAERSRKPMIIEFDGCTYIRFQQRDKFIHKANCSNPDHKQEDK